MAVAGGVVTLAGPAASAAEVEETRVALITLGSIHSRLAHTYPWAERDRTEHKINTTVQKIKSYSISFNAPDTQPARDEKAALFTFCIALMTADIQAVVVIPP